jgi:hypothetical protein
MSDLESRARAIVEAGRDGDLPSAADHARIKRAVLVQIAASGAVAASAAAGTLSLGAKVGLVVLTATLVGGGAVGLHHVRSQPRPAVTQPQAQRQPLAPPVVAPVPEPVVDVAAAPARDDASKKPERVRRPLPAERPSRIVDEDPLTAEVAVLRRAREELRLGRPTAALAALVEYDRRFGEGVLGEERQAIAAIAACQATPGPTARAQGEAFMRKAPRSPLRDRVREACITGAAKNSP